MSARDETFEQVWIHVVERDACVDVGWRTRVRARLRWAEGRHGDRWKRFSFGRLLTEIRSECEDLGGWPVLAAQWLEQSGDVDEDTRQEADRLLREIAAYGAMADELVGELQTLVGPKL